MRYLTRDQIDSTKWDRCVGNAYNSMVYGLSWYLDTMADNWSALVLGDYEAVMPLPFRSKYGFRYLYQPSFTQQCGIFSSEKIQRELVIDFVDAIPVEYKYVDIHLNKECLLYEGKEKLSLRNNFILDLNATYEVLRKSFSANSRMNIKRTERPKACPMRLGSIDDPEVVIELFVKNQVKYSDRFNASDFDKLKALVALGQKEKTIEIIGVYDAEDKICAASILLSYKNRKISIFSGSNQLARKEKAMFFLFDRFIKQHAGQNMVLDFAGSNDPGLANFYSGFASANEQYPGLKYNRLPWPLKVLKK